MQTVSTDSDFFAILNADRAIIFIDFAWSEQSRLSAAVVEEWERTSNIWGLDCPVFRVRPDDLRPVADWMSAHGRDLKGEGGYGSLVWLRSGAIMDYEPYVVGAGLRDISHRTRSMLRKEFSGTSASPLWDKDLDV